MYGFSPLRKGPLFSQWLEIGLLESISKKGKIITEDRGLGCCDFCIGWSWPFIIFLISLLDRLIIHQWQNPGG
jgi:hypothetical protein